ncbi:redoxin family protein [Promicromonospora soli]
MRSRRALTVFVAAGALLLAGCASGESAQPADDVVTTEQDTTEQDAAAADPTASALTFTATTVDGEDFDAADLAGRPAVFWFWAPWCPTCVSQSPQVRDLAEEYGDQVSIVGIAGFGGLAEMEDFVEMTRTEGLTHLNDESGEVWRHFGITSQSTFAIVDENGVVTGSGYLELDELAARVADLAG